jgi:predicted ArsR family transcriptional regulator
MEQLDLLTYPNSPGYKRTGTSKRAAEAMKPRAPSIRARALELLKMTSLTADEIAEALNVTVLACRPRVTELFRMGKIRDTGRTRRNSSGVRATVWESAC